MKFFKLISKDDDENFADGIEFINGTVTIEWRSDGFIAHFANVDELMKRYNYSRLEWEDSDVEFDSERKHEELVKLLQQIILTMPRSYTYTTTNPLSYEITCNVSSNKSVEESNKWQKLVALFESIHLSDWIDGESAEKWLASEL